MGHMLWTMFSVWGRTRTLAIAASAVLVLAAIVAPEVALANGGKWGSVE